jgi:hypothetical protein
LKTTYLSCAALAVVAMAASSCGDPVHANAVAALGPEAAGVREGPTHRPGQPCTVCHSGSGPGSPVWSIAGTIYQARGSGTPAADATVTIYDAAGKSVELTTNGVGNFYIEETQFAPVFPLSVTVAAKGYAPIAMTSLVNGTGGCAECHRGSGSVGKMPSVYLGAPIP